MTYRTLEDLIEQRARVLCAEAGMQPDEMTEWADQGMEGRRAQIARWQLFQVQVEVDIARALKLIRPDLWANPIERKALVGRAAQKTGERAERMPGFYRVKPANGENWQIARWNGYHWYDTYSHRGSGDIDWLEIGECVERLLGCSNAC